MRKAPAYSQTYGQGQVQPSQIQCYQAGGGGGLNTTLSAVHPSLPAADFLTPVYILQVSLRASYAGHKAH